MRSARRERFGLVSRVQSARAEELGQHSRMWPESFRLVFVMCGAPVALGLLTRDTRGLGKVVAPTLVFGEFLDSCVAKEKEAPEMRL